MDGEAIVKPNQLWLFHDSNNDVRLCKILQIYHKYSSFTAPMRFNSKDDKSGFLWIQILEPTKVESSSVNETDMKTNMESQTEPNNLFSGVSDDNIPLGFRVELELESATIDSEMIDINTMQSAENKMDIETADINESNDDMYEIKDELSIDDNMNLLRLLPISQLHEQISDINDPNVINKIKLSDLPTLREWKTFWNSEKGELKNYQWSCDICRQKFCQKKMLMKHI
eukprot:226449_1